MIILEVGDTALVISQTLLTADKEDSDTIPVSRIGIIRTQ